MTTGAPVEEDPCPGPGVEALLDSVVPVGAAHRSVRSLLTSCLSGRLGAAAMAPAEREEARLAARFLQAGAAELAAVGDWESWVQVDLGLRRAVPAALYGRIEALVTDLLGSGQATNAFFMHKPPGLRVRVQARPDAAGETRARLEAAAAGWAAEGLVETHGLGTYEAEATLFGGPEAMAQVHRLFTAEAMAWLPLHARPAGPGVVLAASLLLLRHLFAGMGIVDWEDLEVWAKVRGMGRALGAARDVLPADAVAEVSGALTALWADPAAGLSGLGDADRAAVMAAALHLRDGAPLWRSCLRTEATGTAPRAAAALYVIFLWNRAGLPWERQALVAEALASRPVLG